MQKMDFTLTVYSFDDLAQAVKEKIEAKHAAGDVLYKSLKYTKNGRQLTTKGAKKPLYNKN